MSRWCPVFLAVTSAVCLFTLLFHNSRLLQKMWEERKFTGWSYHRDQSSYTSLFNHNRSRKLFIVNDSRVRKCLNGKIIGAVPKDIKLEPFKTILKPINISKTDEQQSFREIFVNKLWGQNETSVSGLGSGYYWTQEMAPALHVIVNHLKEILKKSRIKMLDIPCGEMLWTSRFLESRDDVDYTGVDIVPELIDRHKKNFTGKPYKFVHANILEVGIKQQYDLIFSRHMLQHLFNQDIEKFLKMASESGSKYLLTTTFPTHALNEELYKISANPGRFREVNLEIPPFSLSPPICTQADGPSSDPQHHHISLWKLPLHRVALCSNPRAMLVKDTLYPFHACGLWGKRAVAGK